MNHRNAGFTIDRRKLVQTGAAAAAGGALFSRGSISTLAMARQDGEPISGGTLLIGQDFGPQSMQPAMTTAWASTNIEELIYTGLLRWTSDMEIEPDLATSYETPDETTYVFHLREGVTFHNGADMTAEDVKYTFDYMLDPANASTHYPIFSVIDSVDVIDPLTVQFNLSAPFGPFLRYLATIPYGAIVPNGAGEELANAPIGTGPFVFVEHQLDQAVYLRKNEDYYEDGLPYLDEVVFQLYGDDTSIASAIQAGSVDMTWLKNPIIAQNVAQGTEGLQSFEGVSSRYLPIEFNQSEPPFDDVRVRRAMSLALDRQALVDTVLGGYGAVGTFIPPSQLGGYEGDGSDLPYYTRDVEAAKALLKEAGYDTLDVPEFKIVAANQLDVQCAQLMQAQWAEAGINVEINPMEVGAILDEFSGGDFQMATVGGVWRPDPDRELVRFSRDSPLAEKLGRVDEELFDLIDQGRSTSDEAERIAIYEQIQQHMLDQVYILIPYVYPLRWELIWEHVHGYDVTPSNARMSVRETWKDEA